VNPSSPFAPGSGRIVSVDALRGFDMFWIIGGQEVFIALLGLVVSPIPSWITAQMDHVPWEGFSVWDLIMPLFLFIVGTAMPLSFARRMEAGASKRDLYRKIFLRVVVLFVLGMVAQGNLLEFDRSTLYIYCNTLQAIACGYLIASIAMLHLRVPGQIATAVGLLLGFFLLMRLVPVPGYGAGLFEEKANLALYIEETLLGSFRDHRPVNAAYTWILSGMGFGATVLAGVLSGHLLRAAVSGWKKTGWLLAIGALCLALGWAWSQDWMGSLRCPIIKHIFSSSMVLWACGWSYLLLAAFYLVIDVLGFRRWAFFFVVIGSNAILAYMSAHLIDFRHIANGFVGGLARNLSDWDSSLLRAIGEALGPLAAFAILWMILWYLYRKGTLVRI
jgi:predicted acyltransferase